MGKSKHKKKVEEQAKACSKAFKSINNTSKRSRKIQHVTTPAVQKCQKLSSSGNELLTNSDIRNVIPVNTQQRVAFGKMQGEHNKEKIFFSGKKSGLEENVSETENSVYIRVVDNEELFTIVDVKDGAICWEEGSLVYALVPRELAIAGQSYHYLMNAFETIEYANPPGKTCRGKEKTIGFETDDDSSRKANYDCVGLKANRNARGLVYAKLEGFTGTKHETKLEKNAKRCTNLCRKVLPLSISQSLNKALKEVNFKLPPKNNKQQDPSEKKADKPSQSGLIHNYFLSSALGRGTYLELHTDDDAYFSGTSAYRHFDIIISENNPRYSKINFYAPILKYFCFEVGHAVALRTGDVLFFNTQYAHCISTNTEACSKGDEEINVSEKNKNASSADNKYSKTDVFCLSHYMKTLIAAGNDNSRE